MSLVPEPLLACRILAAGRLIGQCDAGSSVLGRGFLEPSLDPEAGLQKAVEAASHDCGIILEATASERVYSRRLAYQGGLRAW